MKFQERVALSQVACVQSGVFARCAHLEQSGQHKQTPGFNA